MIYLGSDHAGFELKESIKDALEKKRRKVSRSWDGFFKERGLSGLCAESSRKKSKKIKIKILSEY
jgi:hypothetical protein